MTIKKNTFLINLLFLFLFLTGSAFFLYFFKEKPKHQTSPLQQTISFLQNNQKESGLFLYEFDFVKSKPTPWENLIHQAFTTYVLTQRLETLPQAKKALEGLVRLSQKSPYQGKAVSFNLLDKTLQDPSYFSLSQRSAEISTTALGLLSIQEYERQTKDYKTFEPIKPLWKESIKGFMSTPSSPVSSIIWFVFSKLKEEQKTSSFSAVSVLDKYFLSKPLSYWKNETEFSFAILAAKERYAQTHKHLLKDFISKTTKAFLETAPALKENPPQNLCLPALALKESGVPEGISRSEIEEARSLSLLIQPQQKWIALGQGGALYTKDIPLFQGAYLSGLYEPKTNLFKTASCLFLLYEKEAEK